MAVQSFRRNGSRNIRASSSISSLRIEQTHHVPTPTSYVPLAAGTDVPPKADRMSNATVSSPEPAAAVEATKETVAQQAASAAATVVPPAPVKAPAVVPPGACVGGV